jgi:hypothetical protein
VLTIGNSSRLLRGLQAGSAERARSCAYRRDQSAFSTPFVIAYPFSTCTERAPTILWPFDAIFLVTYWWW